MPNEGISVYFTIKDGASQVLKTIGDQTKALDFFGSLYPFVQRKGEFSPVSEGGLRPEEKRGLRVRGIRGERGERAWK